MVQYVFIDESGDLGARGSRYLILAALILGDDSPLKRIIKNMRRHKFRKELAKASEIKANHSSKPVIEHLLAQLNKLKNVKIVYVVLEKKKLVNDYLRNDKHKLYNYVAGKLAKNLNPANEQVIVRIDKSKGKQVLQEDFNASFKESLPKGCDKSRVTIFHSYSQAWVGLQFADVLAWACFQKFEHSNSAFIDLIEIEQEVFHTW